MDIEKAGCYKLYRCRSLLACDSGGTVYETSQKLEDSDGETFYKNPDESQSESGQSESIIYIIDKDNRVTTSNSSLSQQSFAIDPNTHLDDDEFNNYEPYSSINNESQCDFVQYIKEDNANEDENCKYYIVQCDDIDSTQNSAIETLDSDSFDKENFEYYCDPFNISGSVEEDASINSNNSNVSGNAFVYNQEVQLHNLSNFSQETIKSFDPQDVSESEIHSPIDSEVEPTVKQTRKRKQTYKVKNDSFSELLDYDDSSDTSSASEISKKKKPAYSKNIQRRKWQLEKSNPFENLKMSSILKKGFSGENQMESTDYRKQSLTSSNDENSEPGNISSTDEEVFSCSERSNQSRHSSYFPFNHNFFKTIDTPARLNSDLTNADYLEYVQPRERIVESDMDKLLSPTIELEISPLMNHCKVNEFVQQTQAQVDLNVNEYVQQTQAQVDLKVNEFVPQPQAQVDCNGNEVVFNEFLKKNSYPKISPSEIMEKQFAFLEKHMELMEAFAKKVGFPNYFNTSNEFVVEEILFNRFCTYKKIQLDIDLVKTRKKCQPKLPLVLLENIDEQLAQLEQPTDRFKNVACSLKDTLNDFANFGEFSEDNIQKEVVSSQAEEAHNVVQDCEDTEIDVGTNILPKVDEFIQLMPNGSFNSSFGSSSIISDVNANYDSSKYAPSPTVTDKQSVAPLKLRIKKSDDNKYVIDDSSMYNQQVVEDKKSSKSQKNPDDKYECSDCPEKFRTKKMLISHISENHKGPYDSECEICHMKSKKSSAHKKHKIWCKHSTALKCGICQKVYCYKGVLERHMRTHKD